MEVLVTADIKRKIEYEFPELNFSYAGYALQKHIPLTHDELVSMIEPFDILISEFDTVDRKVIDAAPNLKLIICCRGGVHTVIDVPYATQKGIAVKNTPARNATAVAEYVLGVIFCHDRNIMKASELVKNETLQNKKYVLPEMYRDSLWGMDSEAPYHVLRGKGIRNIVLGVIGYGNVGNTVVNMANLLGIRVLVHNRHPIVRPLPAGVQLVSKDYLLENADYVSLHCSSKDNGIVMGEDEFKKMKHDSFFINTARGSVVDENALMQALDDGQISGAALDVTKQEPLPQNSPLVKTKNLIVTPHIAGSADEVIEMGTDMAIYHIRDFIANSSF